MASSLAIKGGNYAVRKLLNKELNKNKDKAVSDGNDPYFTYITDSKGRRRKVQKQIPDFIPEHDAKLLYKAKKRAYSLDASLGIGSVRFGWSSVIGIIPGFGDFFEVFLAYWLVYGCCSKIKGGLPAWLRFRMLMNIMVDFGIGLIPILGDIADALYRCNTRNVALLENYLKEKHAPATMDKKTKRRSGYRFFDNEHTTEPSDKSAEQYADIFEATEESLQTGDDLHAQQQQQQQQQQQPSRKNRWSVFGGNREQPPDVEAARPAASKSSRPLA